MTSPTLRLCDRSLLSVITSLVFAFDHTAEIEVFAEHLSLQSQYMT